MQRKNNIVLRLHRQRKPEQVLLPLVREDNGEALRVILEKQDNVTAEFIYRTEKKVRSGWLKLEIEQDGCRRSDNLEEELPVILEVETEIRPEAMTAMYLLNDWWTRPAFINDFSEIPELTQAIYGKLRNGYFFLLPMPGKQFKTQVKPGRENTLIFGMSACKGGISKLDEPVYAYAEADSLQEAVHACMAWAAEYHGIRLKEERNMPEMLKYLGWCSWDAFYTEISEEKVRAKGREFAEKNVPVRWMLMDDGWLSVHGDALYDLAPEKEKFPNGFAQMIRDIKRDTQVDWFGVWHALCGYWVPGFGLSFGITITMLGLIVIIPLCSLVVFSAKLSFPEFLDTITRPRVLSSYAVSFFTAFVAAAIDAVMGMIIAWVLVRYDFPGKAIMDGIIELPFALPTAVAGIALTHLTTTEGWVGAFFQKFGIM